MGRWVNLLKSVQEKEAEGRDEDINEYFQLIGQLDHKMSN